MDKTHQVDLCQHQKCVTQSKPTDQSTNWGSRISQPPVKTHEGLHGPARKELFVYNENQCGLFQILHVALTQLTRFTAAWGLFLMSFGIYNPGWRCQDIVLATNITALNHTLGQAVGWNDTTASNHSALGYGVDTAIHHYLPHENDSSTYNKTCPVPDRCVNIAFDPSTTTIVTKFQLICENSHIPSIIISIQMAGMFFGSLIAGQVGESFGRKVGIYSSTAVLIVSSGLAVLSTSWQVYSVFIFGIGFGCGGILATFMIISTEFLGPKWRGRFAAIPVSNVALGIFGCIILATKDWVFLHLITAGVSALAFLGALWVPESLLWLRIHGTPEQTAKVLRKIAVLNRIPIDNKEFTKTFIEDSSSREGSFHTKKAIVVDLFKTQTLRILTVKCLVVYSCIQMSYYTIGFGVQALPGDFYTNFLMSVLTEGPVSLLVGPTSNGFGRKRAACFFTALSSVLCLAIAVVYHTVRGEASALAIRILAIAARATVVCIVQTFNTFMIELFPTTVRRIAFGFTSCISRVGLIFAPFLIPTSQECLPISFSCLAGALLLTISFLVTLPETKNKRLSVDIDVESVTESTSTD